MEGEIQTALRRKAVASETIRDALGDYISREGQRIIVALAKSPASLEALLEIRSDAKAYYRLTKELELGITKGD